MIGGALVRFHSDRIKQSGDRLGSAWKDIKTRGPTILRDVLTETAMEGLKGLNASGKGGKPNWKGGLPGVNRGATGAVKCKAMQEIKRSLAKKFEKTCLDYDSNLLEACDTSPLHGTTHV